MPNAAPHSDFDALDRRAWMRQALPDYGPDWQAAIEMGVDVVELDVRLHWTPDQRLRALCAMQAMAAGLQRREDGDPSKY